MKIEKKEKNEWMRLPEANSYSKLGLKTLRNAIADGSLDSYKPRKYRLVKRQDLDKLIESSKTKIPV